MCFHPPPRRDCKGRPAQYRLDKCNPHTNCVEKRNHLLKKLCHPSTNYKWIALLLQIHSSYLNGIGRPALCRGSGNPAWEAGNPRKTSFSFFARRRRRRGREEENQGTLLNPGQERLPLTTRLGGRSIQRTCDRKVCFVSC